MKRYRCVMCGHIYDSSMEEISFADLSSNWVCPTCGYPKRCFVIVDDTDGSINSYDEMVKVSTSNVSITRNLDKCINCGLCLKTCKEKEGMDFRENSSLCVNCGQCVQACPVKSLLPKNDLERFIAEKKAGKTMIAYLSPSVRIAFGDIFDLEYGKFTLERLVGFLKQLGFDYVLDTTFAADLVVMEEASELVQRIKNKGKLPMFTSCCPAWVKYAEQFYPTILENISTCKSPIGMMGMVVNHYFTKQKHLRRKNICTVAITPCTAKKYEIAKDEIQGTDLVLTLYELEDYIKSHDIKYDEIKECSLDAFAGSGAGAIFGNTGGVMEAALRTSYYLLTGKNLLGDQINFHDVRGYNGIREASIPLDDGQLNICVVDGIFNAKKILDEVARGVSPYHYIEIMNCVGGCIGGGGQPKIVLSKSDEIREKRIKALYQNDASLSVRLSHENQEIRKLYDDFLGYPLSPMSKKLLHTTYKASDLEGEQEVGQK